MSKKFKFGSEVVVKTLAPVLVLWTVFYLQQYNIIDTIGFRTSRSNGVFSILSGPLLHANLKHIVGNTITLLVTLPILASYYSKYYWKVIGLGIVIPSLLMFILGFNSIGISGLVYCILWFIMSIGLAEKNRVKFWISVALIMFYGSTLLNATTLAGAFVAWQAHLTGLLVGVYLGMSKK